MARADTESAWLFSVIHSNLWVNIDKDVWLFVDSSKKWGGGGLPPPHPHRNWRHREISWFFNVATHDSNHRGPEQLFYKNTGDEILVLSHLGRYTHGKMFGLGYWVKVVANTKLNQGIFQYFARRWMAFWFIFRFKCIYTTWFEDWQLQHMHSWALEHHVTVSPEPRYRLIPWRGDSRYRLSTLNFPEWIWSVIRNVLHWSHVLYSHWSFISSFPPNSVATSVGYYCIS